MVWEQMEMDAVIRDFDRLFPSYSFDGKAVLSDIMGGQLWEALKKLGGGISGAVLFQKEEIRALFFTILVLGVAAALFSNFADLFRDHQVSDIAFYFVYLLLIAVLLKFFGETAGAVKEILSGVVTAETGAAVRDIINVATRRNPYVQIILYPAIVQGAAAAPSIINGIRALEKRGVDTIIVGRGGGSIEDLWAFNEEAVAQAVFDCSVPIISAVGHETDVTITDFDEEKIEKIFKDSYERGDTYVTLKCEGSDIFRKMQETLIGEQGVFRYLDCPDKAVSYVENEKQYSLSFWL